MNTSKNANCWCGSEKQFKRCHYPQEHSAQSKALNKTNISIPSRKLSYDQFMKFMNVQQSAVTKDIQNSRLQKVLADKKNGVEHKPSLLLIDKSHLLTSDKRKTIIDIAAKYVNQNIYGRNEMCLQFAILVKFLLKEEGISSKIIEGKAKYSNGNLKHEWNHFWLVTENNDLIDGNIDSLPDNPNPPEGLRPLNYWGALSEIPNDRLLLPNKEFSEQDEATLEIQDDETIIWKLNSKIDYKSIFS